MHELTLPTPLLKMIMKNASEAHIVLNGWTAKVLFITHDKTRIACAVGATNAKFDPPVIYRLDVDSLSKIRTRDIVVPADVKDRNIEIESKVTAEKIDDSWVEDSYRQLCRKYFTPVTEIEITTSKIFRNLISKLDKLKIDYTALIADRTTVKLTFYPIMTTDRKAAPHFKTPLTAYPDTIDEVYIAFKPNIVLDLLPYDLFRSNRSPTIKITSYGEHNPFKLHYTLLSYDFTTYIAPLIREILNILKERKISEEELEIELEKLDNKEKAKYRKILSYIRQLG